MSVRQGFKNLNLALKVIEELLAQTTPIDRLDSHGLVCILNQNDLNGCTNNRLGFRILTS